MFVYETADNHRSKINRLLQPMRVALLAVVGCIFLLSGLVAQAHAATSKPSALLTPNGVNMGSLLLPSTEPGYYVEAPRLKTDVEVDVSGPVLRVKVTQRFVNPSKGWVEGTYVFPLPEDSAVDELRMQIGDRFIEGQIKPRQEAREIYEQAKAEGKKAALLEQQRPNIFTNQVANIGPGETIVVQIEYQQAVHQSGNEFSFRFPMVVAPRYSPMPVVQSVKLDSNTGYAIPEENDPAELAKIQPPVLDPRTNAKINPVTLKVNLNAGFPLGEVTSPHHKIALTSKSLESKVVVLETNEVPADRDFELIWKAEPGKKPSAGLFRENTDGKDYLLAFVTPPTFKDDAAAPVNRETIFIIDNSGSMGGESIVQAKKSLALAIAALRPEDKFNVIRFDDTYTVFFDGLVNANDKNKKEAIDYVERLDADGGTEMLPALQAALTTQGPVAPGAIRQVVFLTDGAISNEADLFNEISRNRGDARVFTVGIGSAPNSYFMTKAAEVGRGTFTHVGSEGQIGERMAELFKKLESPVMTDITASFDDGVTAEITPNPIPDLYAGEPVLLTVALPEGSTAKTLNITGTSNGTPWRASLDIANAAPGKGIGKLWARRKIADLEALAFQIPDRNRLDKEIETLAMEHHLVSRMTSLVAVDVTPSRPDGQKLNETDMPLNLPDGWDFEKVFGEAAPAPAANMPQDAAAEAMVQIADMSTQMLAAAPTKKAAALTAARAKGVALPQTATSADRYILLGLMMLGFALMGGGLIVLSRNGFRKWSANE